jgi:Carboxypeptidase regulatory-like domain
MFKSFNRSLLVSALAAISLISGRSLGCSCGPPPPPCQAVGQSQLVFLGTVTEIDTPPGRFKTIAMNVDRAFKGDLNKTIELFDDGMCNAPDLQAGRQYLMYTWGSPGERVPARGCSRSRNVEFAEEDLTFLKQYVAGKTTTHIGGTVRLRPDASGDGESSRTALKDVQVTVASNGKQFRATTDSVGSYLFPNLPPGKYSFNADLSGYRMEWAPDNVALSANACSEVNLVMNVDRRVEGVIRDERGSPVSGAQVEMVSVDPELRRQGWRGASTLSDEDGKYTISGIGSGEYYLGVNIESAPTKQQPYPTSYYPNTPNVRDAMRIVVNIGPSIQERDLRISQKLSLVKLHGRVQMKDGKPPDLEDHPTVRIIAPEGYQGIENEEIQIDVDGRFEFELCEGIKYSAFAFLGPPMSQIESPRIAFTPTRENDQVILILDKAREAPPEPGP